MGKGAKLLAFAIVGGALLMVFVAVFSRPPGPPSEAEVSQRAAELAKQPERERLLSELTSKRIFTKVDFDRLVPDIVVGPAFYLVDFDAKQSFVSVVYAYARTKNPKVNLVQLHDSMTGKKVGTFNATSGLELE